MVSYPSMIPTEQRMLCRLKIPKDQGKNSASSLTLLAGVQRALAIP